MKSKRLRVRNMMYVSDLDKLNPGIQNMIKTRPKDAPDLKQKGRYDVTQVIQYLTSKFPNDQFVAIVHDHDVKRDKNDDPILDEHGNEIPRKPHLHIGRRSKNPASMNQFARIMGDSEELVATAQNVSKFEKVAKKASDTSWENLVSYLFHQTKWSRKKGKFPYPFEWGAGNFDYKSLIQAATAAAEKADLKKLRKKVNQKKLENENLNDELLEEVRTGKTQLADMAYDDDLQRAYAKNRSQFETASTVWIDTVIKFAELRKNATVNLKTYENDPDSPEATLWRKRKTEYEQKLKELNANIHSGDVYYICGASGSGKTYLAERIGSLYDDDEKPRGVFRAAGRNHQFDTFNQQYSVVMDDLRSDTYTPEDLLTLINGDQFAKYLDARYKGSRTADLRCLCLTNTNSLDEFVRFIPDSTDNGDAEDQYFRRFRAVYVVGAPTAIDDDDLVVSYTEFKVVKKRGIGKAWFNNEFTRDVGIVKNAGSKPLKIYRQDDAGNYYVDHYSDYFLQKGKTMKMIVPVSALDNDVEPVNERKRVTAGLAKMNRQAEIEEMGKEAGYPVDEMLKDYSNKQIHEIYQAGKKQDKKRKEEADKAAGRQMLLEIVNNKKQPKADEPLAVDNEYPF